MIRLLLFIGLLLPLSLLAQDSTGMRENKATRVKHFEVSLNGGMASCSIKLKPMPISVPPPENGQVS